MGDRKGVAKEWEMGRGGEGMGDGKGVGKEREVGREREGVWTQTQRFGYGSVATQGRFVQML